MFQPYIKSFSMFEVKMLKVKISMLKVKMLNVYFCIFNILKYITNN